MGQATLSNIIHEFFQDKEYGKLLNCYLCENQIYVDKEYTDDKIKCTYGGSKILGDYMCRDQEMMVTEEFIGPESCPRLREMFSPAEIQEIRKNYLDMVNAVDLDSRLCTALEKMIDENPEDKIEFGMLPNGQFNIKVNSNILLYYSSTGRWRNKGYNKWYRSKSPEDFVKKYVVKNLNRYKSL